MNRHFPLGDIKPFTYFWFLSFIFGLIFSLLKPHEQFSYFANFGIWQLQTHLSMLIFVGCHALLVGKLGQLAPIYKLLISSCIASVLFTPVSLLFDVYLLQDEQFNMDALLNEWLNMAPSAMLSWLLINVPWLMGFSFHKPNLSKDAVNHGGQKVDDVNDGELLHTAVNVDNTSAEEGIPHFFSLANLESVQDLLMLKAELHYLNVISTNGKKLILYNLKDAIEELAKIDNSYLDWQVHRSYWVNKPYIQALNRSGREGELIMPLGNKALVSRSHMAKVRRWLE